LSLIVVPFPRVPEPLRELPLFDAIWLPPKKLDGSAAFLLHSILQAYKHPGASFVAGCAVRATSPSNLVV